MPATSLHTGDHRREKLSASEGHGAALCRAARRRHRDGVRSQLRLRHQSGARLQSEDLHRHGRMGRRSIYVRMFVQSAARVGNVRPIW